MERITYKNNQLGVFMVDNKDQETDEGLSETGSLPPELLAHPSYQELLQKLNEAEQTANQASERLLRAQAENENIRRRAERDVADAHKYALKKFAEELLPIVDSLELCLTTSQESNEAILEGVKLTLKMFLAALEKFGITQVNPLMEPFNPELHQAISMQYDAEAKPGTVLSVLQKGYVLNNRLLRPALVMVATNSEE
jgi:molecular chaperone GrpE